MIRKIFFAVFFIGVAANGLMAQEWYIPKRTEVLEKGSGEFGTKFQLTAHNDGLCDTRRLELVPNVRYSPIRRFEIYTELPVGEVSREYIRAFQIVQDRLSGVGDLFTQVSYEAFSGTDWKSLAHLDVVVPNGKNPYDNQASLSGGHFSAALGVSAMKVVDPVVLFGFLGIQQPFARSFDSTGKVAPGTAFRFRFGSGISLNPKLRTSLSVSGDFTSKLNIDGEPVAGSAGTSIRFGWGLDWNVLSKYRITMDTSFGMTPNTTNAVLVWGVTRKF